MVGKACGQGRRGLDRHGGPLLGALRGFDGGEGRGRREDREHGEGFEPDGPAQARAGAAGPGLEGRGEAELLEQMVEQPEMTPIEEPDLGRILGYLATHYGPDRPNFPRPKR